MHLLLALAACSCPHTDPLVGGGVWMSDLTENADTADSGDTAGSADTGTSTGAPRTTTVVAAVTAIDTLGEGDTPTAAGTPRGVQLSQNGPWTHLALSGADGATGDAWFIAGAPELVAVGETVHITVRETVTDAEFALAGDDGAIRLWVAELRGIPYDAPTPGFTSALDTVSLTLGSIACSEERRCQSERHHDLDVQDANGAVTVPLGGTAPSGEYTYIHGGDVSYDHISTAFTCGEPWGLAPHTAIARVRTASLDADALWP